MKKTFLFFISLIGVTGAKASELVVVTIKKENITRIDEPSLRILEVLSQGGSVRSDESGSNLSIELGTDVVGQRLYEHLKAKGLVEVKDSMDGTVCVNHCFTP